VTAHRYTEIRCDVAECGRSFSDAGSAVDVRDRASKVGDEDGRWTIEAKHDWCPDHRSRASQMRVTAPNGALA
jgi:hypothetical protein